MTEFSRMSPVAQVHYLQRQHAKEISQLTDTVRELAKANFKLRQEVTGGLQIVWALANMQLDKRLTIPAAELVTAMGSLQRSRNIEDDTYTFEALQPTDEQHQKLADEIDGASAAVEEQAPGAFDAAIHKF